MAVSIGATMFWRSKPKDTIVDDRAFHIVLPGRWMRKPSADPTRWVYRSEDGDEQVTISVLSATHQLDANERSMGFQRILELRRRAETETPGSNRRMQISEPILQQS